MFGTSRRKVVKPAALPERARAMSVQSVTVDEFLPLRVLGQGAFGAVLLVRKRSPPNAGKAFAMKVMDKDKMIRRHLTEAGRLEREVLRSARHPFLVRLRYAFQSGSRLFLVMDYYAGGPLDAYAARAPGRRVPLGAARFVGAELAAALRHLHKLGVIHRDLKPANVLIDTEGHVAIADYGLSVCMEAESESVRKRSFVGTLAYVAPELLRKDAATYDGSVDWWALGCILFEVLEGRTPFEKPFPKRTPPRDLFKAILFQETPPLGDADAAALVSRLLQKDRGDRPPWKRIRDHAFFAPIDWARLKRREVPSPLAGTGADGADGAADGAAADDDRSGGRERTRTLVAADAADVVQVPLAEAERPAPAGGGLDDSEDEPDLTRPKHRELESVLEASYPKTQRLMAFLLREERSDDGADGEGLGRPDAFAGFGYRSTEDSGDLEADAVAARGTSPRSPRPDADKWWWQRAKGRLSDKLASAPKPAAEPAPTTDAADGAAAAAAPARPPSPPPPDAAPEVPPPESLVDYI